MELLLVGVIRPASGGGSPGGFRLTGGGGTKGTTNRLGTAFKPMGARA